MRWPFRKSGTPRSCTSRRSKHLSTCRTFCTRTLSGMTAITELIHVSSYCYHVHPVHNCLLVLQLAHYWNHRSAIHVCFLHSCLLAQHCMLQMQMILLLADQVLGQHSAFPSRSMSFSRVPPAMHTSSVRCTQRCQSFIQPIN